MQNSWFYSPEKTHNGVRDSCGIEYFHTKLKNRLLTSIKNNYLYETAMDYNT